MFFCLFEYISDECLKPILAVSEQVLDDSINTIMKYIGKTNESFTRLMVNLAWASSQSVVNKSAVLFDPLCGKGTTLFEGAIWGYDTIGIDANAAQIQESKTFFAAFLKRLHYNHELFKETRSVSNKKVLEIAHCDYANNKEITKKETRTESRLPQETLPTAHFL